MKILLLNPFIVLLFIGCAGSFTSKVTAGYDPPPSEEIAITYLDHADISISNRATNILEEQLRKCKLNSFLSAEKTTELLQQNKIDIPKRPSANLLISLKKIIPVRYLLTGAVSVWREGSMGFFRGSSTEVSASFTMYDLTTGTVVWSVSGQEEGASGMLSEWPSDKAKIVFRKMLKEWDGFCVK